MANTPAGFTPVAQTDVFDPASDINRGELFVEKLLTDAAPTPEDLPTLFPSPFPGEQRWVISEKCPYVWNGSSWVGAKITDANGWLADYSNGLPKRFTQFFDAWGAGNAFGAAGGSFWTQSRGVTLSPPVGHNWDDFIIEVPTWATSTASNQTQELLRAYLSPATGTNAASITIYNPTAIAISNTNMTLRCGVILTLKS